MSATPLSANVAFPTANNTANSPGLDLATALTVKPRQRMKFRVSYPALGAHSDANYTVTMGLQNSSDNGNWSNINPLQQISIAGVANTGASADNYYLDLPEHASNYVRLGIGVPNGGPNLSNLNVATAIVYS